MRIQSWESGSQHVLHDAEAMAKPSADAFDPEFWRARKLLVGSAPGRGAVAFVRGGINGEVWALRAYRRGGWVRHVVGRHYLWEGLEQSRPFREFTLTAGLFEHGLPVPRPVAARVVRSGPFYRGELITRLVEHASPLAEVLSWRELPAAEWAEIGALLARFQVAGVRHDDINARNILREGEGRHTLIDFDKAVLELPGPWQEANLARLRRSLEKFRLSRPEFRFTPADWDALLEGYRVARSA